MKGVGTLTGADRRLIFFILLVGGLLLAWNTGGFSDSAKQVKVILEGRECLHLTLDEQKTGSYPLELPGGQAVLEVKNGAVRLLSQDKYFCPQKICVRAGWISKPGETIVCVPNRLVVRIVETGGDLVDAVSR